MLALRPYQQAVKDAVYHHLRTRTDSPACIIPAGAGKTHVVASICADAVCTWRNRVLILTPAQKLVERTAAKLVSICPEIEFGIYSAGVNSPAPEPPVVVADIKSIYTRAAEVGCFDLVLIDNAHLMQPFVDGNNWYFLKQTGILNPDVRTVGFAAVPFQHRAEPICGPNKLLNTICFQVSRRELVRDGFLCPLISKAGRNKPDTSVVGMFLSDFFGMHVERLFNDEALVRTACAEIVEQTANRSSCLIFASGLGHGQHLVDVLQQHHRQDCGLVARGVSPAEWTVAIDGFKSGRLKFLCDANCDINDLTPAFALPSVDSVVLLRPTMSPALYHRMISSGSGMHPGKENCLVLDFGGNVLRHGPIDDLRTPGSGSDNSQPPAKECSNCQALVSAAFALCPQCDSQFLPPECSRPQPTATRSASLSQQVTDTWYDVCTVICSEHVKTNAGEHDPKSLRVDYLVRWVTIKSEWICLEHSGRARRKAIAWWQRRSPCPVPDTVARALRLIQEFGLAPTLRIKMRKQAGERFERVVDYELGPISGSAGDRRVVTSARFRSDA